jgi:hypothetical protein
MGWADDDGPGDNPTPSELASCLVWALFVVGLSVIVWWLIIDLIRDLT